MWLLCKQLNTVGFSLLTYTTSINCQSQETVPSHLTVPFLVVSEKFNTCHQKVLCTHPLFCYCLYNSLCGCLICCLSLGPCFTGPDESTLATHSPATLILCEGQTRRRYGPGKPPQCHSLRGGVLLICCTENDHAP